MIGTPRAPRGHNKYSTDAEIRLIRRILCARTEQPRSFNDLRDCYNRERMCVRVMRSCPSYIFHGSNDGTGWLDQEKYEELYSSGLPEEYARQQRVREHEGTAPKKKPRGTAPKTSPLTMFNGWRFASGQTNGSVARPFPMPRSRK